MESQSPFMPMFEGFKAELDEHHDRRERVIKASRDITAASKKIIFALQRAKNLNQPLHPSVIKASSQHWDTIKAQYKSVAKDLQGLNAHRYAFNITGGNQEFMEALSFQHYLEHQSLISYDSCCSKLAQLGSDDGPIPFSVEDYILGIFDMTGELMRFGITSMATNGKLPGSSAAGQDKMDVDGSPVQDRTILSDLRDLRTQLEMLELAEGTWFATNVEKKMGVMTQSVEKVEKALYELIIRGRERPKGWVPDLSKSGPEPVAV